MLILLSRDHTLETTQIGISCKPKAPIKKFSTKWFCMTGANSDREETRFCSLACQQWPLPEPNWEKSGLSKEAEGYNLSKLRESSIATVLFIC